MPYLNEMLRDWWDERLTPFLARLEGATSPGVCNYIVTRVVLTMLGPDPRYEEFNRAIGALECAKLELYRRMVAPYEDKKCAENGDVYPTGAA